MNPAFVADICVKLQNFFVHVVLPHVLCGTEKELPVKLLTFFTLAAKRRQIRSIELDKYYHIHTLHLRYSSVLQSQCMV